MFSLLGRNLRMGKVYENNFKKITYVFPIRKYVSITANKCILKVINRNVIMSNNVCFAYSLIYVSNRRQMHAQSYQ